LIPAVLGYQPKEFEYVDNINSIIPATFAGQIHDDIMMEFMRTGKDKVFNKLRDLFVRTKDNFLVKINVYITLNLLYPRDLA
jgi:hypothetical protein